ncbi:MAG TPA: hypothetical protein PK303_04760 [bacterium]|mgnify:CR=1 FL=1|nr:hypothetical protein [bacterium]HOL35054.1 hypothetical protein [bacterium]HPP08415.1 hypothetical protein [bacterium]
MKKIVIILFVAIFSGTLLYSGDMPVIRMNEPGQAPGDNPALAGKVKELLEIQKKMFDIERTVIQQDQELKQLAEQIRSLQAQLRNRIEEKLKDNQDYQALKQRRDQIRLEYRKVGFKKINNFKQAQP